MTSRMPVDELGRRASDALDHAVSNVDAPPAFDLLRQRMRRGQRRRIAAVAAATVALATVLVGEHVGGGNAPVIVDRPTPEVGPTQAPTTTTRQGWTLIDDRAALGGGGAQVVAAATATSNGPILVGIDAANAAEGRTRPGVWRPAGGADWRRAEAGSIGITGDWDEAGVLMSDVAVADDGRLVAVGYANFEPREQPVSWTSTDEGRTWSPIAVAEDDSASMAAVVWTGQRFVAVGGSGAGPTTWSSTDGTSWVRHAPPVAEGSFHEVTIHAGRLVAVSTIGDSSQVWTADPAEEPRWEPVESPVGGTLSALRSDGDVLYAIGTTRPDGLDHDGVLLRSPDGMAWELDGRSSDLGGPEDQLPADVLVDGEDVVVAGQADGRAAIWTSSQGGPMRLLPEELLPAASHASTLVATTDALLAVGTVDRETGPDVLLWSRDRSAPPPVTDRPATACESDEPPSSDAMPAGWSALTPPPEPRARAASIWTGDRLLLLGGDSGLGGTEHSTVFSYDPSSDSWTCATDAPFDVGRDDVVWTGKIVYAWSGRAAAAYDPTTDTWQELPTPPDGAPSDPLAVAWTGSELIVWGSTTRSSPTAMGVAYDPDRGDWRHLPEAPITITQGGGIWTGAQLIVYGARLDGNNRSTTATSVGAAYDPASDDWQELPPSELSPQAASIAWTGQVLVAWDYELAAGAYDPAAATWTGLPDLPLAFQECYPDSAVLEDGRVFAWYCGQAALLDPEAGRWEEIETPITSHSGRPPTDDEVEQIAGEPVAAGMSVYFAGAAHEGHANALWRWQPSP